MAEKQIKSADFEDIITKEGNTLKYVAANIDYNQVVALLEWLLKKLPIL